MRTFLRDNLMLVVGVTLHSLPRENSCRKLRGFFSWCPYGFGHVYVGRLLKRLTGTVRIPAISLLFPVPDDGAGPSKGTEFQLIRPLGRYAGRCGPTNNEYFPVKSLFSGNCVEHGSQETRSTASK